MCFPNVPTAAQLTAIYATDEIYIPANAIARDATTPPTRESIQIPTSLIEIDALRFDSGATSNGYITIKLPDNMDITTPNLRARFHWLQTAADDSTLVAWETAVFNRNPNGALNSAAPFATVAKLLSQCGAAYTLRGGKAGDLNAALSITGAQTLGDSFKANQSNLATFLIRRDRAGGSGDTMGRSAYLIGVSIQYKTNFANLYQWTT